MFVVVPHCGHENVSNQQVHNQRSERALVQRQRRCTFAGAFFSTAGLVSFVSAMITRTT